MEVRPVKLLELCAPVAPWYPETLAMRLVSSEEKIVSPIEIPTVPPSVLQNKKSLFEDR